MTKRWTKHLPGFIVALAATVIGGYIVARLSGTPPSEIAAFLWSPFRAGFAWFAAPAHLTRWDVILIVLGLVALDYFLLKGLRRVKELAMGNISNHEMRLEWIEHPEKRPRYQVAAEPQADTQPPARGEPKSLPKFEPEKFKLTAPRSRALLGLLQRVDARTTLDDLYRFVVPAAGPYVDMDTSKGQLQSDMEEAERLGIVSIDRISALTHCYSLTAPDGRDWVLRSKPKLLAEAPKGMKRRDLRSPY